MAGSYWSCTSQGISTAIIDITDRLEEVLNLQNIFCERERLTSDRQWLNKVLTAKPGIQYIRVVVIKPEGGTFIKRRHYFDAYLLKRNIPGLKRNVWWMYLVPIQK